MNDLTEIKQKIQAVIDDYTKADTLEDILSDLHIKYADCILKHGASSKISAVYNGLDKNLNFACYMYKHPRKTSTPGDAKEQEDMQILLSATLCVIDNYFETATEQQPDLESI